MCIRISAKSISGEWLPVDVPGWAWCGIMMVLADYVCVIPLGGAGKTGKNEDNGCICSRLSSEISVSDAKDSKNIIRGFGLIGSIDLGG